jgi:hypothetical protein
MRPWKSSYYKIILIAYIHQILRLDRIG